MSKRNKIRIKSGRELDLMRAAGKAAAEVLWEVSQFVAEGLTTKEVDLHAAAVMKRLNCRSAFLGYRGFPAHTCLSVNEEVVHGIGSSRVLQPGDLLSIDVGVVVNGWIGDNAMTVAVGEISHLNKRLLAATEQSLHDALAHAVAGRSLADLCGAVEACVKPQGFTVVREFVGHGVGRDLHEEPQIPNYRPQGKVPTLLPGMTLAIEPMVNAGTAMVKILDDGWTVITADRQPSAHFEHTVLVTDSEPEILTARPRTALPEQLGLMAEPEGER